MLPNKNGGQNTRASLCPPYFPPNSLRSSEGKDGSSTSTELDGNHFVSLAIKWIMHKLHLCSSLEGTVTKGPVFSHY